MMKNFLTSLSKTMPVARLSVSHTCFSEDQMAKLSLLALTVASLDNYLVFHARCNCRTFVFIVV